MMKNNVLRKTVVILFWIGVWAVAAAIVDKPLLLPSPVSVAMRIFSLVTMSEFWKITVFSLLRIMAGILVAIILGIIFAIAISYNKLLNELLSPILTIIKVTPVASFIILVLIWIARDIVPAVIAALMVLPVVCNNVSRGLLNIDSNLLEMAKVYQIPKRIVFKRITIPSVMPFFLAAMQTSIGIGWKAGIAAEVLTVPTHSIGKMIYESKIYMETVDLFAWTIVVIIISIIIETIMIAALTRLSSRYRTEESAHG